MLLRILLLIVCVWLLPVGLFRVQAEETERPSDGEDGDTFLGMDAMVRDAPVSEEGEASYDESDLYTLPAADALPFDPERISLSENQSGLLLRALGAVACNYPSGMGREQVPMGVKQMALALARRLEAEDPMARQAEYALRRGRAPRPLPEREAREAVAAKLWNAGFGLYRYAKSEDDRCLAACVLDLAARFHPADAARHAEMAELGLPDAGTRWENVTEIPALEATDAEVASPGPEAADPEVKGKPVPERFAFAAGEASIMLFAGDGGDRVSRLGVRLVTERSQLPATLKRDGLPIGLDGEGVAPAAAPAMEEALAEIDRRHPGWRETGGFLHYTLTAPVPAECEPVLADAAVVLAGLLADGKSPDPFLAVAGGLGGGGVPGIPNSLANALAREEDDTVSLVAVPEAADPAFGDLAVLGDLEPLLARQYLAYTSLEELATVIRKERPLALAAAIESFGEIQKLAARNPAGEMLANRHVQQRLRAIVDSAPNHLSARHLLAVAVGRLPSGLSLPGSVSQLRGIERPLRELIVQRLHPSPDAPAPDLTQAASVFSASEFALRRLRPILHPDARPFADGLVRLIDDLRVQIRADAARSAVLLQGTLDDLEVQVARFASED